MCRKLRPQRFWDGEDDGGKLEVNKVNGSGGVGEKKQTFESRRRGGGGGGGGRPPEMMRGTEGCVDKTRVLQERKTKGPRLPQKASQIAGPISNGITPQDGSAVRRGGCKVWRRSISIFIPYV